MSQASEAETSSPAPPLAGRNVYSPAAVAGYAALCGLPVAYILHGLNLRARGYARLGLSWVCFGLACIALVLFLPPRFALVPSVAFGASVFGGIAMYQVEGGSYVRAIARGASRARWWPPALVVIALGVLALIAQYVLEAVA